MGSTGTPPRILSEAAFLGVSALLFAAGVAAVIAWCTPAAAMAWAPICGGGPAGAAAFLGIWGAMTAAMMLPSLVPMLRRYRRAVAGAGTARLGLLTALAGLGYFTVWMAVGMAALPLDAALARATPAMAGAVVLAGGAFQFSAWKARQLAGCRAVPGCALPADAGTAWRHGLRLGLHCAGACAGLTAILLATGAMDPRAMAVVAAAITLERLAPAGARVPQAIGALAIGMGLSLIARAAGFG